MHDFLMAKDSELWDIIIDGPYVPTVKVNEGDTTRWVPKSRQQYSKVDIKKIEKNYTAKKLIVYGIGAKEYNRISPCESAKEIQDCLKNAHDGTEQVIESKVDMLTSEYEDFLMMEGESIHDMQTKFSAITNELKCLGEPISQSKQVRKIFRVLPNYWERKVDAITESKNLKTLIVDVLIGIPQTYELNKQYDTAKREGKKDKTLALKIDHSDEDIDGVNMAYLTKRFKKIIRKIHDFKKK